MIPTRLFLTVNIEDTAKHADLTMLTTIPFRLSAGDDVVLYEECDWLGTVQMVRYNLVMQCLDVYLSDIELSHEDFQETPESLHKLGWSNQ